TAVAPTVASSATAPALRPRRAGARKSLGGMLSIFGSAGERPWSRPGTRRVLLISGGVLAAASAMVAGALTTMGTPAEAPTMALISGAGPQIPDDALSRDMPPSILGPTPLILDDADTE